MTINKIKLTTDITGIRTLSLVTCPKVNSGHLVLSSKKMYGVHRKNI